MITITAAVKGIYRLTLISPDRFNIIVGGITVNNNIISTILGKGITELLDIIAAEDTIVRSPIIWYAEFVVDMSK